MPTAPNTAPAEALASLEEAFELGELDRAREQLAALQATHAADLRVRTQHARLLAASGDMDGAVAQLRAVVEEHPGAHEAAAYLGAVLVARKDYDEGVKFITNAMERGADVPAANHALGVALAAVEQYEHALPYLGLAAEQMPSSSPTFFYMGVCYAELGEFTNAEKAFLTAVELNPLDAGAVELLARVRVELGRAADAVRALEDGLRHHPEDGRLKRLRIQVMTDHGDADAAAAAIQEIPPDARTSEDEANLAIFAMEARQSAAALEHARHAVDLDAEDWNAHYVLGLALEMQEPLNRSAVTAAYRQALALGDPQGRAGTRLGFILSEDAPDANPAEAIEILEGACERSNDDPASLLNLALAYVRAGRHEEARPLCTALLEHPNATHRIRDQAERLSRLL